MTGMAALPRFIRQPGPPALLRATMVPAGMVPLDLMLPAGRLLLDSLADLMAIEAIESACLTLSGGAFGPFAYVMPSAAVDAAHAAYYSNVFRPQGSSQLETAALTLGWRDGAPWFHCHARWREADGKGGCGHVLPPETRISAPIRVQGAGMAGARFEVRDDPETGFSLLMPVATGTLIPPDRKAALAIRLAPNQDLTAALENAGRAAGFRRAILHGGVASLIGVRFADAPEIAGYATEVLVRHGLVRCAPGAGPASEIEVAAVDYLGSIGAGRLVAGDNPVLMTFEGLLEAA